MAGLSRGLYVFYENGDGSHILLYSFFDGASWTYNQVVPNTLTSGPPALAVRNNNLYCFHQGADGDSLQPNGQSWLNVFDGVNWRGDQKDPHTCLSYHPSVVSYNGQLYMFHQGGDCEGNGNNALWYNIYQGGGQWAGDVQVGNTSLNNSPSVIVWASQMVCFHQSAGNDNKLWIRPSPQNEAIADEPVSGDTLTNSPAVVPYNNNVLCFYQSSDGTNTLRYAYPCFSDPPVLSNPQSVPGGKLWYSPAPCIFNNRVYCFHHSPEDSNGLFCQVFVGNNWAGDFHIPNVSIANSPAAIAVN